MSNIFYTTQTTVTERVVLEIALNENLCLNFSNNYLTTMQFFSEKPLPSCKGDQPVEEINALQQIKNCMVKKTNKSKPKKKFSESQKQNLVCTFIRPQQTKPKIQTRSFKQFLQDQQEFTQKKKIKLLRIQQHKKKKENQELTLQPAINKVSHFHQNNHKPEKDVYTRLYQSVKNNYLGPNKQEEKFIPTICRKSKQIIRKQNFSSRLYKDALRRSTEKNKKPEIHEQFSMSKSHHIFSKRNAQLATNAAIRHFEQAWILTFSIDPMTQQNTLFLLQKMGYLKIHNGQANQNLCQNILFELKEYQESKISKKNLKHFIMILEENVQPKKGITQSRYGYFENGQWKIKAAFYELIKNRMSYFDTQEKINYQFTFAPSILKKSKKLEQSYKQRIIESAHKLFKRQKIKTISDQQLEHADLLYLQKKLYQTETAKKKEEKKMKMEKLCTFKPKTMKKKSTSREKIQKDHFIELYEKSKKEKCFKTKKQIDFEKQSKQCKFTPSIQRMLLKLDKRKMNNFDYAIMEKYHRARQNRNLKKFMSQRVYPYKNSQTKKSCSNKHSEKKEIYQKEPLFYLSVKVPSGQQQTVIIYQNDDIERVATQFSQKHNLSKSKKSRFFQLLAIKLNELYEY